MKRECETCIKRKTTYCPTSIECMATDDMPYYQNRIMLLEENKQLKERIEYLERSNNRREDTILEQRQKISDLEDNWNKLKGSIDIKLYNTEYLQKLWGYKIDDEIHMILDIIKKEMKELEDKK